MSSFYNLGSWGPKQASLCFRVLSEEVTQCRLKLRSANSLPESFLWTMTFSWLFCFFPPLEYGTNWSECQWPACQPVFRLCIFPELAILSRKKKKKVLFLTNKEPKGTLLSQWHPKTQPMNEAVATTWAHPFPPEVADILWWSLTNTAASSLTASLWTQEVSLQESHVGLLHSSYGLWAW